MSVTCNCTDDLSTIQNNQCSDGKFGNQLVKLAIQKPTGVDFDDSISGHKPSLLADWQTALAATGADKVIIIDCNAVRPSATPNTLKDNDVPFGGQVIIDLPQTITGFLTFPSKQTLEDVNKASCLGKLKFGFIDNNSWYWCDSATTGSFITNANLIFGTALQEGIGSKVRVPFTLSWTNAGGCQPEAFKKDPFYITLEN